MEDLRREGRVVRGWLGASLDDVTMETAAQLQLPAGVLRGAVITSVREGEPAAVAGLQQQDVVVAINQTPHHVVCSTTQYGRSVPT
jgi:serine protease Do